MGSERDKLEGLLGGIANMKKIPDMIFIIDTNNESIAVKEAQKLNIPIVAIIDTNSDPTGINFPIPGNDDARRAINLYCDLIKNTILDAQKNIKKETDDLNDSKQKKEELQAIPQKVDAKTKVKTTEAKNETKQIVVEKKSSSLLSKIKSLTSKKSK